MRLALREAWKGLTKTKPNPMVGAVIVAEGKVLARGHHAKAGEAHAEIAALNKLTSREQARGTTLYITLEPCSTHGRTPPCTEAIIHAGFARVVYGATDPNPQHQGEAKKILEAANISVTTGVLAEKCTALNHAWNHRMKTGMPWIIAKCGMSLDGRIASPDRRWITSEASRRHAMLFRRHVDAILVGGNTVRCDNPRLTIRGLRKANELACIFHGDSSRGAAQHDADKADEDLSAGLYSTYRPSSNRSPTQSASGFRKPQQIHREICGLVLTPLLRTDPFVQPWRIVWTRAKENIPKECHLLTDEHRDKTIILENGTLREGLQDLAARGISSVLIEGGGITLGKAFEENLVDEVRFYIAPIILGGGTLAIQSEAFIPSIRLKNINYRHHLNSNLLVTALVEK